MKLQQTRHFDAAIFIALAVIICGSFCYLLATFPNLLDDLEFRFYLDRHGLWDTLVLVGQIDNSRIGNNLTIILLEAPYFISVVIEIIAFIAGFIMMLKISGVRFGNWRRLALFSFILVFGFQWSDNFLCKTYAFNYIVEIPLLFGLIYVYLYDTKIPTWAACILAIILGAWHETYGLAFLSGCVMYWLIGRKRPSKKQIIIFVFASLGAAWLIFNPGNWERADIFFNLRWESLALLAYGGTYFLYVVLWLCAFYNKRLRAKSVEPYMLFSLGAFVFIPFVILFDRTRAIAPSAFISICALTSIIPAFSRNWTSILKTVIAVVLIAITIFHLTAVNIYAAKIFAKYRTFEQAIASTPTSHVYVFTPMEYTWQAPFYTLQRPSSCIFDPRLSPSGFLNVRYHGYDYVDCLPQELKSYSGQGEIISDSGHIRQWNGHIVSDNLADTISGAAMTYYERSFAPEFSHIVKVPFTADNGTEYLFIYPKRSILSRYFGNPVSIKLL